MSKEKYPIVTISGSMKFFDTMIEVSKELSNEGKIVLMPYSDKFANLSDDEIEKYRQMHFQRIDMCDELYVVNKYGYTGSSTREEIEYANKLGKPINYLWNKNNNTYPIVTLIGSMKFKDKFPIMKRYLEDQLCTVFIPSIFDEPDISKLSAADHLKYDLIHQRKMMMSDYVLVMDIEGYKGGDTRNEISFCEENDICVKYLSSLIHYKELPDEVIKELKDIPDELLRFIQHHGYVKS